MNNLMSYCGLVDQRISASEKWFTCTVFFFLFPHLFFFFFVGCPIFSFHKFHNEREREINLDSSALKRSKVHEFLHSRRHLNYVTMLFLETVISTIWNKRWQTVHKTATERQSVKEKNIKTVRQTSRLKNTKTKRWRDRHTNTDSENGWEIGKNVFKIWRRRYTIKMYNKKSNADNFLYYGFPSAHTLKLKDVEAQLLRFSHREGPTDGQTTGTSDFVKKLRCFKNLYTSCIFWS